MLHGFHLGQECNLIRGIVRRTDHWRLIMETRRLQELFGLCERLGASLSGWRAIEESESRNERCVYLAKSHTINVVATKSEAPSQGRRGEKEKKRGETTKTK